MKHLFLPLVLFCTSCAVLSAQEGTKQIIQHFMNEHAASQGYQSSDVAHWAIRSEHTSRLSGAHYVYFHQTYKGIEVANGLGQAVLQNGSIRNVGLGFIANIDQRVQSSTPKLNPLQATERAALALGLGIPTHMELEHVHNSQEFILTPSGISQVSIPVKLVYFQADDEHLRLAWDLSIYQMDGQHWWSVKVDAITGELINKVDWVVHCDFGHGRNMGPHVHYKTPNQYSAPQTMMQPDQYTVFALPAESPNHGPHVMVTNPADSLASPYAWHDTDGVPGAEYTITRGNNVYAYEDADDDNQPGFSPDGNAVLEFNFPYTAGTAPNTYRPAAITNLFYMNNIMHDIWYHYGFDEASGNFQTNNYGRGGAGNDEVHAEAQDGGGTNNANFATPPDGNNPRMQMYLWTGSSTPINALDINSPASVAGSYGTSGAAFGPGLPTPSITADLVLVEDVTAPTNDGCDSITNVAALAGRIAVIDRGNCSFVLKVEQAEAAGAIAVIVINNVAGATFQMGGTSNNINIPSVIITQADGNTIKAAMTNGTVNGTISDPGTGNSSHKDGDFDNGIIAHEYGHGISIRISGGPTNSNCLNTLQQMGEGWSDWFGLMLTIEPGDQRTDARGIGTFAAGQPVTGQGIRPAPYTTDFNTNGFTYGDIVNNNISVPHGMGFVYATALWDMTWDLIDFYGGTPDPDLYTGTGGNNIAMALVIESLKQLPCDKADGIGMVDGRNSILKADSVLYNGAHHCLIWKAFARRGFGEGASNTPNSRSVTESFALPLSCQTVLRPPVAAFTPSATNTCITTVSFTDNSINVPQSWLWRFGDGDSSTVQNPSHTYTQSGIYTVTLVVTNTSGSDTLYQQITILLPSAPVANDVRVCEGDSALLTATASGDVHWRDGSNNVVNVGNTFTVPNVNSVQTYYLENVVTTASQFIGPANPNVGTNTVHSSAYHGALNFTASRALEIVSVYVEARGAGPRTFFLASGSNSTGTPPTGATIVDQVTVNLVDGGQRVNLNLNVPSPGNYNLGGNNVNLVRNSGGAAYPYMVASYMSITSSSATTNPTNYYYYFYDLEIRDPACISVTDSVKVFPVTSDFTFTSGNPTVHFSDASTGATSWAWDFGDSTTNSTSSTQNPTHTYTSNGTYTVTLTINDSCVQTKTVTIQGMNANRINGNLPTLQLLPNPATDQTALLLSRAANEDLMVEVRDATGKSIFNRNLAQGTLRLDLPIGNLPAGVYLVSIQSKTFTRTEKLVIE